MVAGCRRTAPTSALRTTQWVVATADLPASARSQASPAACPPHPAQAARQAAAARAALDRHPSVLVLQLAGRRPVVRRLRPPAPSRRRASWWSAPSGPRSSPTPSRWRRSGAMSPWSTRMRHPRPRRLPPPGAISSTLASRRCRDSPATTSWQRTSRCRSGACCRKLKPWLPNASRALRRADAGWSPRSRPSSCSYCSTRRAGRACACRRTKCRATMRRRRILRTWIRASASASSSRSSARRRRHRLPAVPTPAGRPLPPWRQRRQRAARRRPQRLSVRPRHRPRRRFPAPQPRRPGRCRHLPAPHGPWRPGKPAASWRMLVPMPLALPLRLPRRRAAPQPWPARRLRPRRQWVGASAPIRRVPCSCPSSSAPTARRRPTPSSVPPTAPASLPTTSRPKASSGPIRTTTRRRPRRRRSSRFRTRSSTCCQCARWLNRRPGSRPTGPRPARKTPARSPRRWPTPPPARRHWPSTRRRWRAARLPTRPSSSARPRPPAWSPATPAGPPGWPRWSCR